MLYEFSFTVQQDSRNNWRHFTRVIDAPKYRPTVNDDGDGTAPTYLKAWAHDYLSAEVGNATVNVEVSTLQPQRVGYSANNNLHDRITYIGCWAWTPMGETRCDCHRLLGY